MLEITRTPGGGLRLAGDATLDHAAELRRRLVELGDRLAPGAPLDLSALEGLDAAGARVLLDLRRRIPLRVAGLPRQHRAWLERAGLAGALLSPGAP